MPARKDWKVNMEETFTYDNMNRLTGITLTRPSGSDLHCTVTYTGSNKEALHYVLKDNLGSWTTITDGKGLVEQQLSYDAWGNLRNPNTWANYTAGNSFDKPMFDRGYTGHEHLTDFGLVNMNGRVYDPVMSSFLSADRFVQNPLSAMGFNRYSYCLNNPLRYVDPSGWLPGDGGNGDHPPGVPYLLNGVITIDLPEVDIGSNSYNEFEYTPYYYGGGGVNEPWNNIYGSSSNQSKGCGGGGHLDGHLIPFVPRINYEDGVSYQQKYKLLLEYWQKKNPELYWDKNGDGKLQKKEADNWWLNAKGIDVYVDNSLIDWSGLQIPEGLSFGDVFSVETMDAFMQLPMETAFTYGGTCFKVIDNSTVEVVDQLYHYRMRDWNSLNNILRNMATFIGKPGVNGTDYMIHYYNPRITIKK